MFKVVCFVLIFAVVADAEGKHQQPHQTPHSKHEEVLAKRENNVVKLVGQETTGKCSVGGDVKPIGGNPLSKNEAHVFTQLVMVCDGNVTSWEFYARQAGHFMASIWREVGIGHYELVGQNELVSSTLGKQVHRIPRAQQIVVKEGDVIGIYTSKYSVFHRKDGSSRRRVSKTAVVAFEDQLLEGNCDNLELAWIKESLGDLDIGSDVRFNLMSYRRAAIQANVQAEEDAA